MAAEPEKETPEKDDTPETAEGSPESGETDSNSDDEGEAENRRARRAAAARARKQRVRERREAEAVGLDTQEVLDDAIVRSQDRAAKWMRKHSTTLQLLLVAGVVGWAGWGIWGLYMETATADASAAVAKAIASENGRIGDPAEMGRPDEQGIIDPTPIFADDASRLEAAQKAFEAAAAVRKGSGTALYAELALGSVYYDLGKLDEANQRYQNVLGSDLGRSDPELSGRAMQGIALVLEGKGDKEAALAKHRELQGKGQSGFVEAALYDIARISYDLGKTDEAKQALDTLVEKLGPEDPTQGPSFLRQRTEALMMQVDPEAAKALQKPAQITPEQLRQLQEQMQQAVGQQGDPAPEVPPDPSEPNAVDPNSAVPSPAATNDTP